MRDNKVIDLAKRRTKGEDNVDERSLILKLSSEQLRAGIATALVSLIFLVTLANNSLLSAPDVEVGQASYASTVPRSGSRAIASVPTGTSDWEDQMVSRLSKLSLNNSKEFGVRPSALDKLTLETLEGRYAVRLENGKIRELNFANGGTEQATPINDRAAFLNQNRELLPVSYNSLMKVESKTDGDDTVEAYELVDNTVANNKAKVWFRIDSSGRLISMKIN